ncbi:uncharacterized protein LOC134867272 isoform X2 [Eleginops maclovinus]|uniref:uncharacterized protein LOC134867272 isoform X2 n=1 Tax=Eleginops maclovinus TaxID=56733 RepID=UPI0030809040
MAEILGPTTCIYSSPWNARGETVERKLLKKKMEFHPPPLPTSVKGAVPNMLAFFTTHAFFWRPVGAMQAKIRCPNADCCAPPGEYLELKGFGSYARQVCGVKNYYTLLTEKLKCPFCEQVRQPDGEDARQYLWMAYSPKILMKLAPAIRCMFPAILCGKRAIDRGVVTLLGDRLNSTSMSKVQRLLQQGHDEWYVERRDLYQTLLYEAHTAEATPSQTGILSYVKAAGSYTPPLPKSPLPCPAVLRRAHLISEMERIPVYRASILSTTGEILCIDGTKKILKKIYGDGRDTMQYVTSVLNEWGQFVTTVVVAAESEGCYRRMARGLIARFQRAKAPAPKIIYADNNCCRDSGSSFLETLFHDWVQEGTAIRLDVRHWLHRWEAVVIKQSHAKYGVFMSALAGAVMAYNRDDMMLLVQAVRNGNPDLYVNHGDVEMIHFLKPHQVKAYVRRITRGVEETASVVEAIIAEFKGPAGLDIDGIHLFKSAEAVDAHWENASKHLSCMQDPPGIQLYVSVKEVVLNGVRLNKYRCRRGSNSLEGLHAHLYNAVPSKRCGILPFQVYLITFAVQWNSRMDSLRVAGGKGRQTTCMDARQIQRMNRQAEVLFGKDHVLGPNFVAPLPYPEKYDSPEEEELLGVEYAACQSTDFTACDYYAEKVEEEQSREVEESPEGDCEESAEQSEEESEDEGVDVWSGEDHMDTISRAHVSLTQEKQVEEEDSPALQDVLMTRSHMHLPGLEEVEALALLLLELADNVGDQHLVPAKLRKKIVAATGSLKDHDKTASNFVKKYESKWGYTLFGRCLGADTPENRAAQKTKFSWMRYAQAAQVTEDTRLLYLVIKMLKNRPPASLQSSPSKTTTAIKAQYKRIVDRVRDDPILSNLSVPLPNLNAKSISNFIRKQEKKANYWATVVPKVIAHRRVLSFDPMPVAPTLPTTLPVPARAQVQYQNLDHLAGERRGAKQRLEMKTPSEQGNKPIQPKPATYIPPRVCAAPVLRVVPAQPRAPSMMLPGTSCSQGIAGFMPAAPPPVPVSKPAKPHRSLRPCGACQVPNCGGKRKRYTPSKDKVSGSKQKIFTFCPSTRKATTSGFEGVVYESFEHFKRVVDDALE